MPIEIRELVIRAEVQSGNAGGQNSSQRSSAQSGADRDKQEDIVNECVTQVLEILRRRKER